MAKNNLVMPGTACLITDRAQHGPNKKKWCPAWPAAHFGLVGPCQARPATESPDPLDHCRQLLASAASATAVVKSFRGQWSAVAAPSAASGPPSKTSPTSPPIPTPLPPTSSAPSLRPSLTLNIALHCRSPDSPIGKLRKQGDIASAALEQLTANATLLRTDALLNPPPAPQAAASGTNRRESVHAEVRGLVTRLQIESSASRIAALDSLGVLLRVDDKNILIAAAQAVVPALLRFLDSSAPDGEARAKAVTMITRIAAIESYRHVLVAEGANLHHLAHAIKSEDDGTHEKACSTLETLTLTRDNAMAIGSRGGIAALLEIYHTGTASA